MSNDAYVNQGPLSPPPAGAPTRPLSPEEIATLPIQALLVRSGIITMDQLSDALRENIATGRAVEEIVVSRGWVDADALASLLAAKRSVTGEPAPVTAPPPRPVTPPPPVAPPPPVQAHAPSVDPAPSPPVAPETAEAAPPPVVQTGETGTGSVAVFLNLADGERLWVGRFASTEAGEGHAAEIIDALMRPEPGVWPRFGNRLVRPGSVVAVELSRRSDD